jgi:hypothetical protein
MEWRADQRQLVFIADVSGQPVDLAWPRGFSAWLLGGRVSLVAT